MQPQPHPPSRPQLRQTILVIDDDPDLRGSLAEALRDAGYIVATAHDGHSALVLLRGINASLILVDVVMPGMSGLDFLKTWTADPRSGAPVVLMTGSDDIEPPSGSVRTLSKPFTLDALLNTIARSVC